MSYTTTATVEGKLAKCKDRWSCFDNNLRKRMEERTTLFTEMKEEFKNFNNLNLSIKNLESLEDVTKNIFEMIEERINHTKVFMPIMEELIKTLKQLQEELAKAKTSLKWVEILSKYRDWIKRLRSVVVQKMNNWKGKKFNSWNELEETLLDEMDNKDLYEDHGEYYDLKYTN